MSAINLNVEKWLRLCRQAEQAALLRSPNVAADDLACVAGRLTTVTEPLVGPSLTALATSFRWDCTAFGMATPEERGVLAEGLRQKAGLLKSKLDPATTPPPVAVAMPAPVNAAWTQRADIGG